ncbi:MAG TPA: SRPBCC family protein [Acidimicrobiales bacterium]
MAQYRTTIESSKSVEEAFDYMADFSNAKEWDPGVVAGESLDASVAEGSRFRLVSRFLGRELPLEYRIVAFDRPHRVVFEATESWGRSVDEVRVTSVAGRTEVSYEADLRLKGAAVVADPLLALAFRRIGDRAAEGLRRALAT